MAGDGNNVLIPRDADVFINFQTDTPTVPADVDTDFDPAFWNLVGLLDGDAGSQESQSRSKDDKIAWGGRLYRVVRSKFKLTRTFTAIERNGVTDRLDWPGSTPGSIVIPDKNIEHVLIAFEFTEGDEKVRLISANYAEVERDGNVTDKESDASSIPFVATIFPGADDALFIRQTTKDLTRGS